MMDILLLSTGSITETETNKHIGAKLLFKLYCKAIKDTYALKEETSSNHHFYLHTDNFSKCKSSSECILPMAAINIPNSLLEIRVCSQFS